MVFYVYFDPAVITAAERGGDYALQCLIGVARGFAANCLLAEFDDYFVQEALKSLLSDLRDDNVRKTLKSLFTTLDKRRRFVYCLTSNGEQAAQRVAAALVQAKGAELDLVLADNVDAHPNPHRIPTAHLNNYQSTNFEAARAKAAATGFMCATGELTARDFMDQALRKALKHCCAIHIYDEVMGRRWGDNFEYTIKELLVWLERFIAQPGSCQLHLYCGRPKGSTADYIKSQLGTFRQGRLRDLRITIHFHDTDIGEDTLPHDRFILTDQIALEIGRGMDFLDSHTQRNRDASVNLKDLATATQFVNKVASSSLPAVDC